MPINLQNEQNIATGWGAMPKLDAPNIGGVLGEILQQRRYQEALTQKNIAGAIKQMQEQRQNQAYLEAMQKAGILPEGDYGALGAEGASDLAKQILAKKVADARAQHLLTTGDSGRGRGRGGGSGGVDESVQVEAPEDYYGLSVAPGAPSRQTTRVINGIVHVHDTHGGWKPGPKWMQQAATPQADPTKVMKQQFGDRFSPEDFNPDTVTIDPPKSGPGSLSKPAKDFDTPSTVTTGTGRKMSLATFQAGVKAMHGGQQASVGGYDDTAPTARPDASKDAPVNLPQVGDQRPGPNGTTIEWDGHGWKIVE